MITIYWVGRYAAIGKSKQPFSTEDWASFSERNLGLAKKAIMTALQLQSSVDVVLARNAANLKTQKDLTDRAFNRYKYMKYFFKLKIGTCY